MEKWSIMLQVLRDGYLGRREKERRYVHFLLSTQMCGPDVFFTFDERHLLHCVASTREGRFQTLVFMGASWQEPHLIHPQTTLYGKPRRYSGAYGPVVSEPFQISQ